MICKIDRVFAKADGQNLKQTTATFTAFFRFLMAGTPSADSQRYSMLCDWRTTVTGTCVLVHQITAGRKIRHMGEIFAGNGFAMPCVRWAVDRQDDHQRYALTKRQTFSSSPATLSHVGKNTGGSQRCDLVGGLSAQVPTVLIDHLPEVVSRAGVNLPLLLPAAATTLPVSLALADFSCSLCSTVIASGVAKRDFGACGHRSVLGSSELGIDAVISGDGDVRW
ncbi:hypothetical protein DJICPGNB_05270 [Escherichia coli]|nr:hypothetical protein DJICPGNB_05270 [Escherichia coli]